MNIAVSYKFGITAPVTHRQKLEKLQESMESMPQADCPVRHYFAPGLYAREMTIPQGVTVVGAVHKRTNLAVLSKGRLVISTESGPREVEAPFTLVVTPGAKNAVYAVEESVWTNFFATEETDPEKLVAILTESTADELLGGSQNKQLSQSGALPCLSE